MSRKSGCKWRRCRWRYVAAGLLAVRRSVVVLIAMVAPATDSSSAAASSNELLVSLMAIISEHVYWATGCYHGKGWGFNVFSQSKADGCI